MPGFADMTREERVGFFLAPLFTVVTFALLGGMIHILWIAQKCQDQSHPVPCVGGQFGLTVGMSFQGLDLLEKLMRGNRLGQHC